MVATEQEALERHEAPREDRGEHCVLVWHHREGPTSEEVVSSSVCSRTGWIESSAWVFSAGYCFYGENVIKPCSIVYTQPTSVVFLFNRHCTRRITEEVPVLVSHMLEM